MPQSVFGASCELDQEVVDDLLYFARTNDLPELMTTLPQTAVSQTVSEARILQHAIDGESGNSTVHFASANGHIDILRYLAQALASDDAVSATRTEENILTLPNASGSTPLHYAACNGHLECMKLLVQALTDEGDRKSFVEAKNQAGHDAAWEAETAGKENCVSWLLGCLDEVDTEHAAGRNLEGDGEHVEIGVTQSNGDEVEHVESNMQAMDLTENRPFEDSHGSKGDADV
ncbi:MAG: hypothetical protein M1828_001684 [Chrysothrix sp. TS-e1954]|nr:MAG: hypothetical protein M1828_001684 [Chrysothrix sp. TS-e1954]